MAGQLQTGRALLQAGNHTAARKISEESLQKDPHDEQALDLLIDCLNEQGAHQKAIRIALDWIERMPLSPSAHISVIDCHLRLRNKKQARHAIDRLQESFPWLSDSVAFLNGRYALVFNDFDRAGKAFQAFAKNQPDSTTGKLGRMIAAVGAEKCLTAMRLGREIIAVDPNNVVALDHLARAELYLMRFGSARAHAQAALRLEPTTTSLREVIWISRVALFPPFLFAHLALLAGILAGEIFRTRIAHILALLCFLRLFETPFEGLMDAINIFAIPDLGQWSYWLALGWVLWLCLFPWVAKKRAGLKSKTVKLAGY